MDLNEKATAARDVVRASGLEGQRYRIEDTDLTEASEIGGEDEFPQFGHFLDAVAVDSDGGDLGERWVETPGALAESLVELDLGEGDQFAVQSAEKNGDGAWTFEVESRD